MNTSAATTSAGSGDPTLRGRCRAGGAPAAPARPPAAVDWRLACASDSLSGLTAAARAGLGVTVLAKGLIPAGLCDLGPETALPDLGSVDFILLRDPRLTRSGAADLAASIVERARS